MWETIALSFVAGLMGGNAIPHFVKGITKENYPTVLGNSPVPNLLAGWAGLVITVLLVYWARAPQDSVWSFTSGALGVLLSGLFHAWHGAIGKKS